MEKLTYKNGIINISNFTNVKENESGICRKYWVKINNVNYLFKSNMYENSQTNVGEVFYTYACNKLGYNCANSIFACDALYDKKQNGCLVENFLNDDETLLNYKNIGFYLNIKQISLSTPSIKDIKYILDNLKKNDEFVFNEEEIIEQLWDMFLVDYFFCQTDRHSENIGFITKIIDNKIHLKLTPIFDNGMCFCFNEKKIDTKNLCFTYLIASDKRMFAERNFSQNMIFAYDSSFNSNDFVKQLYSYSQQNYRFKNKINAFLNLDIEKLFASFKSETKYKFDYSYEFLACKMFELKRDKLLDLIKEKNNKSNLEQSL